MLSHLSKRATSQCNLFMLVIRKKFYESLAEQPKFYILYLIVCYYLLNRLMNLTSWFTFIFLHCLKTISVFIAKAFILGFIELLARAAEPTKNKTIEFFLKLEVLLLFFASFLFEKIAKLLNIYRAICFTSLIISYVFKGMRGPVRKIFFSYARPFLFVCQWLIPFPNLRVLKRKFLECFEIGVYFVGITALGKLSQIAYICQYLTHSAAKILFQRIYGKNSTILSN